MWLLNFLNMHPFSFLDLKIWENFFSAIFRCSSQMNCKIIKVYNVMIWPAYVLWKDIFYPVNSHTSHLTCVCVLLTQLCPFLCDLMDYSPPGPSVHGIFQARILEWAAIPFSRGSSWPRDQTCISCISCIGRILYHCSTEEAKCTRSPYNGANFPQRCVLCSFLTSILKLFMRKFKILSEIVTQMFNI